jgi:cobalt-zinc-cadmium resistance protein CzcA
MQPTETTDTPPNRATHPIDRLIQFSVWNPAFVMIGITLIVIAGVAAFRSIPIDAVPDITNVQVQVNTAVPALAPDTVEMNITYPIESAMGSIPKVEEVRSVTRYGLSQVTISFKEGADLFLARQLVAEQLQSVELPDGVQPELGPISTGLGEIVHYVVEAKEIAQNPEERLRQLMRLRTLQEWDIKPRLLQLGGVAEVNTIGGFPERYYVQPDPAKLARYGVHLDDLARALRDSNKNTGGGYVQQSADQYIVHGNGVFRTLQQIQAVIVTVLPDYSVVTVGDLATVQLDRNIRTGAALWNGQEAVLGTVFMLLGENSRTVAAATVERLAEIDSSLPDWVQMEILYDRSELVDATIETVRENLLYGAVLVIIVLFMLTGNLRAALITAFVIPLSMLATLYLMNVNGYSANLMSLGALDFGIIIDGAVIVIDNCVQRLTERSREAGRDLERREVREVVTGAAMEIRNAAGFGQLIIVLVFLPILALTGVEGKMFRPMATAFVFALVSAFLFSFAIVPGLAGLLLSGKRRAKPHPIMANLERAYSAMLSGLLRFRWPVIGGAVLVLAVGGISYLRLGSEFIPRLYEGSIAMQLIRPVTISIDRSIGLDRYSQDLLLEFPEISHVFSRIGTAEIATDPMSVNTSDTFVMLEPESEWPVIAGAKARTPEELQTAISEKLKAEIPGQRILMSQPIQLRFNELMEGARADVSLKVFGDDLEKLQAITTQLAEIISRIPGAGDVDTELRGMSPVLSITPDYNQLRRYGVSSQEVLDTVQTALGGEEVGHMYRGVRRFPLILRLPDQDRRSLTTIRNLPVGVQDNLTAPLYKLAKIEFIQSFDTIKRESSKRRSAVLINPRGRDTAGVVEEARRAIDKEITLPEGFYMEWGGNFENLESAKRSLSVLAPMALAVVGLMLYSTFRSLRQTLMIFGLVPFALSGGLLNLALVGLPFSISAGVGLIALSGIAVLNGVVLVSFYNELSRTGVTGVDLMRQGARLRLRAVLMTALTDILGFLPMMLASGMGAEVQRPLATVVVGGIITATVATLVLLPLLYYMLHNQREA